MVSTYDTTGMTMYPRGAMPMEVALGSEFHNKVNYHRALMKKRPLTKHEIEQTMLGAGIGSSLLQVGMSFLPTLVDLISKI